MQSQTYSSLWLSFEKAFNDDLPKTAFQHVEAIRNKALAEDCQPQLLRALCTEYVLRHEVSPDSDAVVMKRIEDVLQRETRPVERALWQFALGKLTHNGELLLQAVADPEMLADAKATDYVPAMVIGKDSRYLNDDLLSVLTLSLFECNYYYNISHAQLRGVYERAREVYTRRCDETALVLLDFSEHERSGFGDADAVGAFIARVRAVLPKLDAKGNAAKVLRAWINEEEAPQIHLEWQCPDGLFYPGTDVKLAVSSRNAQQMEFRLSRATKITNTTIDEELDLTKYIKERGNATLVKTIKHALKHDEAHRTYEDTIALTLPEVGSYIAELYVDGHRQDIGWVHITRLQPVIFADTSAKDARRRLVVVDAKSGQPVTDGLVVKVAQLSNNRWGGVNPAKVSWKMLKANADGSYDISELARNAEIAFAKGDDCCHPATMIGAGRMGSFTVEERSEGFVRLYTDRAIYRPGQQVQFGGLVYSRTGDAYSARQGVSGKLELRDTQRKTIAEMDVSTDEFGQFSGNFTLPALVVPGQFSLVFKANNSLRTTEYIRVEEYKRPTFKVTLTAKDTYAVGDTLVLKGLVETFSGLPVPDAQVKWNNERTRWVWLRTAADEDLNRTLNGELTTDAEGRFEIVVPLDAEGRYKTSVEVTASNGETATAAHAMYVGKPVPQSNDDNKPRLFATTKNDGETEVSLTIDPRFFGEDATIPCVFYDLVTTNGGLVESRRLEVGGQQTFDLHWCPEYGEGARIFVAFVRNGELFQQTISVQQPEPDKRLLMEWSTFRDHLQPGQGETWTLTVKRPDGSPADACLMARLYDASLDAFSQNPWSLNLYFDRRVPTASTHNLRYYVNGLYYSKDVPWRGELQLTHWEPSMFDYYAMYNGTYHRFRMDGGAFAAGSRGPIKMMAKEEASVADLKMEKNATMMSARKNGAMVEAEAPMAADAVATEAAPLTDEEQAAAERYEVRENFDETAFFMPCLRTDADGRVAIAFTLPESLTQWNFTALAHDRTMNYGILNDTIFAQKKLSAELAAPRFLREGDETMIPATVRNISDQPLDTEIYLLAIDAATGKTLHSEKRKVTVSPNEMATISFALKARKDVKVRIVAKAANCSDGEERLIPVFDNRVDVQVSVPFSSTQRGQVNVDLSPLGLKRLMKQDAQCQPVLTVEYSANPLWNVVRVIPALLEGEACSANDWATRLYAIEVADFLANGLRKAAADGRWTEDAAVIDSLLMGKDIAALRYSALDHLREYQRGDGGFSWLKGFESSMWITADVSVLLARQQKMTGSNTARTMLNQAVEFMKRRIAKDVAEMKKDKQPWLGETALRYLYVRHLLGMAPDKDAQYLLALAAKEKKNLTMYGKSLVAGILQQRHPEAAALALESLIEHTVATPEMGRYFDTERAFGSWTSYKIPTQTMAVEALGQAAQTHQGTIAVKANAVSTSADLLRLQQEMKLWLLQSKRTQRWESNRASADATYALLQGEPGTDSLQVFQDLVPEGYYRHELTPAEMQRVLKADSYNINKETDGLSWGAVYADYRLPIEQVEQSSAGFTLTRKWEVLRGGKWQSIYDDSGKCVIRDLKIGEHVRQTFILQADRDYDFVLVEASRAACMEPLHPLSGPVWMGGTRCYRMVRDSRNDYYFEHLAKGRHEFSEELIIDRAGSFATGIAHVQSTFAPEFGGYAPSSIVFAISEFTK